MARKDIISDKPARARRSVVRSPLDGPLAIRHAGLPHVDDIGTPSELLGFVKALARDLARADALAEACWPAPQGAAEVR